MTTEPSVAVTTSLGSILHALSDGNRRAVVQRLATGSSTARDLSQLAPVTRQAMAKHLGVLVAAGLVESCGVGRERRYRLNRGSLVRPLVWLAALCGPITDGAYTPADSASPSWRAHLTTDNGGLS